MRLEEKMITSYLTLFRQVKSDLVPHTDIHSEESTVRSRPKDQEIVCPATTFESCRGAGIACRCLSPFTIVVPHKKKAVKCI